MKSIFQDFQSLFESDLIWMQNKYLDEVFKKFSFYLIIKYNDDLIDFTINKIMKLYQKTDYKNIFILEYIEEKQKFRFNSNFFFLCFENTLIIFEISEIKLFYAFISQCKESKIFILSENNEIIDQMKSLQLQIIKENENQILKRDMQTFKQKLSEKVNKKYFSQFKNIKFLFEIIKETISGFLIEKSYCKINEYDRVLHCKEYQEKVEEEKTIEKDSYIILHNLGDDIMNAHLIYDIKREEIFTLKMFFNDEDYEKKIELFERERKII